MIVYFLLYMIKNLPKNTGTYLSYIYMQNDNKIYARLAQLEEHLTFNQGVGSSSLLSGTIGG